MTIAVAVTDGATAFIAADRMFTNQICAPVYRSKIVQRNGWVVVASGSADIVFITENTPALFAVEDVFALTEGIRRAFRGRDAIHNDYKGNTPNYSVQLLILRGGKLWKTWGDFLPFEYEAGRCATIGSGEDFALGSLLDREFENAENRVRFGVAAAISLADTCGGDIDTAQTSAENNE